MDYDLMFGMYCQDDHIKMMVDHGGKPKIGHLKPP